MKVAIPLLLGLLAIIAVTLVANRRLYRQFLRTRAAESQVAYQLALQSSLLDTVPIPVFVVDPQARYTDCNRAYETLFGVQRDAIRGKTLPEWSDPSRPEIRRLHADMLTVLETRETTVAEYRVSMPDGRDIHFNGAARVFALPDGTAGGLVGTVVDISQEHARQQELADARDKAESATKAKSAFLATMSHEIRTPMNGVLGMLELLSHTPLNPEQRNSVAVAQESGRSLLTLLSDVLDLSKVEANRLTLETAPASLRAVAELVIQTLANGARAKGLKVRLFIAPNVAGGHRCDALRVRQILFNLLGNAIKFTRQGWVSLRITATDEPHASPPGQRIVFEVGDSGIGIAPQAQARLFAPFEQAAPSVSREFGGTGLGLAICKRLSDLMDAQLSIESQPGLGSTLRLEASFPVADLQLLAETAGCAPAPAVKVLVLCDDSADQDALTAYLGERQFDAVAPSLPPANAQQLGQLVRAQLPQCAIVLPALLERLGVAPGALGTLLRQSGAAVIEPVVVCLSDFQQGQPLAQRQLYNQPILPSAVSLLLDEWRAADSGPANPAVRRSPPVPGAASVGPAAADPPRILVAEDHPTNQTIVCRQLEMIGCAVTVCADGATALATWRRALLDGQRRFGALLVDCHMPVMDGYDLARRVRACEADAARGLADSNVQPRVPMIALTADASSEVRLQCVAAGMDDLLIKPVDIPTLCATLVRWLPTAALNAAQPGAVFSAVERRATGAQEKAFHLERLVREMGGREAAAGLMGVYLQATAHDISSLEAVAGDLAQARRIAHRIKGAARLVGAKSLEDVAARLEAQADAGSLAPETIALVAAELGRALAGVKACMQEMAEPA